MILYGTVTAVVVGEDQTFLRDEFPGASSAKKHNGILHRGLVDAVNILSSKLESIFLHEFYIILFGQYRYSHTLISPGVDRHKSNNQYQ